MMNSLATLAASSKFGTFMVKSQVSEFQTARFFPPSFQCLLNMRL